ncbi:unnamed protein product [Diamesa hyperborea]
MQLISFDTKEDIDQFISVFTPETILDAWVGYTDEAQSAPLLKVENDNTNIFDANPTEEHLSYCEYVVTTNVLQPEVVNMELHYKKENALLISKLKLVEDENKNQKNQLKVCDNLTTEKYSEEMAQQKQNFRVFNGAGHLRKLNIQGNNIRAIWYYVFEGAGALNVLKMENNNIESLSTEAFQGLNNLETLSLRSNKIKELPVSIFVDLNKIRYLVFSSNQLQELDAKLFENNKEIRELWFDKNNLTKVDSEIFSYSPYIKRAVFTDNNCINIDSDDVCQEMFKSQIDGSC